MSIGVEKAEGAARFLPLEKRGPSVGGRAAGKDGWNPYEEAAARVLETPQGKAGWTVPTRRHRSDASLDSGTIPGERRVPRLSRAPTNLFPVSGVP
ncbi:hypothetical protein KM043_007197 [Ampulex compressa]|nr:hypothetical protein KM043_007197 [Ampulex compressa]